MLLLSSRFSLATSSAAALCILLLLSSVDADSRPSKKAMRNSLVRFGKRAALPADLAPRALPPAPLGLSPAEFDQLESLLDRAAVYRASLVDSNDGRNQ